MKKLLCVTFIVCALFVSGCASSYMNIKPSTTSLSNYGTITMDTIDVENYWKENPRLENDEKWQYQVNRASTHIQEKVNSYFRQKWSSYGSHKLAVRAMLFIFNPGSKAARYWGGFGAGKGKIGYHVKLVDTDTDETIAEFDAYGTVVGGMFGGDIGTAYDKAAGAIIKYMIANQ